MRRPAVRGGAVLFAAIAVLSLLAPAGPAFATPAPPAPEATSEDLREQVATLRAELDTIEVELETAVERYSEAAQRLDTAVSAELAARRDWDASVSAAADARRDAARRVRALYRDGPAEFAVADAALSGRWRLEDLGATWYTARAVIDDDARALRRARGLTSRSLDTSQGLQDARRERSAAEESARTDLDLVEAAARRHGFLLDGAAGDLAAAVEREREAAEALAVAWALGAGSAVDPTAAQRVVTQAGATAPTQAAAMAVAAAATRLGTPYTWGATGPATFDCSGLVLWAYAGAGVGVPRTSRQQYAGLTPVPLDALLPGDLVFYASGPDPGSIHHVGLYVGSGLMIHAPRTGDVVRIAAVDRRTPFGAVRPAPADI